MQTAHVVNPINVVQSERQVFERPKLECEIKRVDYSFWQIFAPFHYLTESMNKSAKCFCLFVASRPVAFCGFTHMPHPKAKNIKRVTRGVCLPDWQGLGLIFFLGDTMASAYKALGQRTRSYPAHPAFVRAFQKNPNHKMVRKPQIQGMGAKKSGKAQIKWQAEGASRRQCAVFEYIGPAMDSMELADKLINGKKLRRK